jgi:hypothetical protein
MHDAQKYMELMDMKLSADSIHAGKRWAKWMGSRCFDEVAS